MSVKTDPIPPVPEHTPPLREDESTRDNGRFFTQTWTRWFVSLRDKINVLDASLVNLAGVVGNGILVKFGSSWVLRTIVGTAGRIGVTNGNGAGGNPTIDLVDTGVTPGSYTNANITVLPDGRLSAASNGSGGGGRAVVTNVLTVANAINLDYSLGDYFNVDLTDDISTLTFSNLPAAPTGITLTVVLTQDLTPWTVLWPGTFYWPGAVIGAVSAISGSKNLLRITSVDQGTVWLPELIPDYRNAASPDISIYNPKVIYDIQDISTLFQDTAGTVPITADGQTVALILNAAPGYTAADMLQSTSGSRPVYRTNGIQAWLENDGTRWMASRSAGALAFATVSVFAGQRKATGFADFGPVVGHPHNSTHTSPFWRWAIQGRDSGGDTVGAVYDSGASRDDVNDSSAAIGLDFIMTFGVNSMWDSVSAAQKKNVLRINRVLRSTPAAPNTTSYVNSNVSTLMSHAGGVVPWKGLFYGAVIYDVPVTSQTWINTNEAWINFRLQVPV